MKFSKKSKFLMTFISSIIFSVCGSSLMAIGNFNVYITSYIHLVDEKINMHHGNFMAPLTVFCMAIFTPVGGILENLLDSRGALLFGSIVMELSAVGFYFQQNIILFYGLILSIGLGYGTSMAINMKNCCFYYPKHKGIISASMLSIGIVSGAGFTMMGEKLINPNQEILVSGEEFFKEDISKNIKKYFLVMITVIPLGALISLIFFQKFHNSFDMQTTNNSEEKNIESINENKEENNSKNAKPNELFMSVVSMSNYNKNLKEALCSLRFWKIVVLASFPILMVGFTSSIFRTYSTLIKIDGKIMSFLPALLYILMGISGMIWALLVDKFKFCIIMVIYCILGLIEAILMIFYLDNSTVFIICSIMSSLLASSLLALINQHIMQLFGIHFQLFLGGIAQVFNGIATLVAALVSVILSQYFTGGEELQKSYKTVGKFSIPFIVVSLILAALERDLPFIYSDENEIGENLLKPGTFEDSVRDESQIDSVQGDLNTSIPSIRNQVNVL